MDLVLLSRFFLWCSLFNYIVLILWLALLVFARNWMLNLHSRIFSISREAMLEAHFKLYGLYKLGTLLFFFVPYLVLQIIS